MIPLAVIPLSVFKIGEGGGEEGMVFHPTTLHITHLNLTLICLNCSPRIPFQKETKNVLWTIRKQDFQTKSRSLRSQLFFRAGQHSSKNQKKTNSCRKTIFSLSFSFSLSIKSECGREIYTEKPKRNRKIM